MTRIVVRVMPHEEPNVTEVIKKLFFSGIEGIIPPSGIEVAAFARQGADGNPLTSSSSANTSTSLPLMLVPVGYKPQSAVVERRIALEYTSDHFPLLTLLDPENEMVPEMAEREDLALHLLNTMVSAHGIALYHGQLNSERVYVHSDEPICYLTDFFVGKSYNPYICPRDYRGPESILRCQEADDTPEKVDVWAMGCLLYELLTTEALFTLPSSKGEDGVTAPQLVKRQILSIVARVGDFNITPQQIGTDFFTSNITDLFGYYKDPQHAAKFQQQLEDSSGNGNGSSCGGASTAPSASGTTRTNRLLDGTISAPFVWAIQQCLTFNPRARPSLKAIRDGLLARIAGCEAALDVPSIINSANSSSLPSTTSSPASAGDHTATPSTPNAALVESLKEDIANRDAAATNALERLQQVSKLLADRSARLCGGGIDAEEEEEPSSSSSDEECRKKNPTITTDSTTLKKADSSKRNKASALESAIIMIKAARAASQQQIQQH